MDTNYLYNTIFIDYSPLPTIKAGKYYTSLQSDNNYFLFDENGKRVQIKEPEFKWKNFDRVVMIAKIKSSLLDSVIPEKIYRVFNDEENDERYIIDENGERVLFDKIIFNYELI